MQPGSDAERRVRGRGGKVAATRRASPGREGAVAGDRARARRRLHRRREGGYTGQLARYLAGHGYAAFDIDYRLKGDLGASASLEQAMAAAQEDVGRAVAHVVDRAAAYGVDEKRIAVGGGSAGAITALLATYGRDRAGLRPRAVVGLWGGMYGQESAIRAGDPPLLLVHGSNDRTVPFAQSEAIVAAAKRAGVEAVLVRIENGGHTLQLDQPFAGRTIQESVRGFLDRAVR